MVGGERVNDKELQERRMRKKKSAERRLNALARALVNVETEDGPNLVLGVYDDIQEELRAKNEALKKYKQKVTYTDANVSKFFFFVSSFECFFWFSVESVR